MTLISALATMSLFSQAKPVNVLPIHRSSRVLTSTRFDQDLPPFSSLRDGAKKEYF